MNSLLDTNVLSEYRKPDANPGVIRFLRGLDFHTTYLSVVTLSEIRFGAERMPAGRRRQDIEHWLEWDLPLDFSDRIFGIHTDVAQVAGQVRAKAFNAGRPMGVMDAFIAATADIHGLTVVTRNVRDFEVWGGPVFNPWTEDPPA